MTIHKCNIINFVRRHDMVAADRLVELIPDDYSKTVGFNISCAFTWSETPERWDYWNGVNDWILNNGGELRNG